MTRVVLGSSSPGRLSLLKRAGVDPLVIVSAVDENRVFAMNAEAQPAEIVRLLAEAKAFDVVDRIPPDVAADCVVIGCDSMLLFDGRLSGKPGSIEAARAQWRRMAGQSGDLLTGHCILRVRTGKVLGSQSDTARTTVQFGTPADNDLEAHLADGEPLQVAGGFTVDGRGAWFIDRIEGDLSNVIGLSLPLTRNMLRRMDLSVEAIWSAVRSTP